MVTIAASILLITTSPPNDELEVKDDLQRTQGTWATTSFAGAPATFTFKGRDWWERPRDVITVALDEKAQPEKPIDMKADESTTGCAVGKNSVCAAPNVRARCDGARKVASHAGSVATRDHPRSGAGFIGMLPAGAWHFFSHPSE